MHITKEHIRIYRYSILEKGIKSEATNKNLTSITYNPRPMRIHSNLVMHSNKYNQELKQEAGLDSFINPWGLAVMCWA